MPHLAARLKAELRHSVNAHPSLFVARHVTTLAAAARRGDRRWSEGEEDTYATDLLPASDLYVDVGAQHPLKSSNTYRLYRRGWHGITVEPNAMLCALHRAVRRRDTVVCGAVGDVPGESEFYEMSPQVCSTFDAAQRDGYVARGDRLVRTSSRRIWTLAELFEANAVPASFGLLSIDVEGWDLRVLSSNDWSRWRPKMVIVEQNTEAAAAELSGFLTDRGYELVGLSLGKNAIYCETAAG